MLRAALVLRGSGAPWNTVTNSTSISNNANWAVLPADNAAAFFRLRRAETDD